MSSLRRAVLDTNIYVDWLNTGLHADLVLGRGLARYLSAVVAMELRVGATTRAAQRALDALVRAYSTAGRLVVPRAEVFLLAGAVLPRLRSGGREIRKASLVNDTLIALTCRQLGATLFTADRSDFEAIRTVQDFALEVVARSA
jgi:predicted nucleic acid-binding protein